LIKGERHEVIKKHAKDNVMFKLLNGVNNKMNKVKKN